MRWVIGVVLTVFVIFLGIGMLAGDGSGGGREDAKRAVRASLKDPDSARFGDISLRKVTVPGKTQQLDVACGTVNAKNSFGGYVGDRRFIAYPKASIALVDDGGATFTDMWINSCI